ncbi:MAG: glutamate 5-kinase [Bacteriovoracaceae bacterium]
MQKRIVIKVGSLAVTDEKGGVDSQKVSNLVSELIRLREMDYLPILVSSGAINTGRSFIQNSKAEDKVMNVSLAQARAAVGQPLLMQAYIESFKTHKVTCAQLLVTHEDFKDRQRFLNIRNTINVLLLNGILPIVNENDTVSYAEITVGDNDQLAVMMAEASTAESLVILSEADGLYDKNPKDPTAIRFDVIHFQDDFKNVKIAAKTSVGRGGMDTKLKAVRKLTPLGVDVILGTFLESHSLTRLIEKKGGTLFQGNPEKSSSRHKAWLTTLAKNDSYVVIDEGAKVALTTKNTSLLPIGIKKVVGKFKRGDVIGIRFQNKLLAVGMTEYDHKEMFLIKGKPSSELLSIIPEAPSKVAIHRDNLNITGK